MNYDYIKDSSIIICNIKIKENILKEWSKNHILKKVKFLTLKDFQDNYFFTYKNDAIYYLMKKDNLIYDVSKEYLDNLIYDYEPLKDLCYDLECNDLLVYNKLFKKTLEDSNLYVIGYDDIDNFLKKELLKYNAEFIKDEDNNNYKHDVYKFNTQSEEINFIAQDIIENHKDNLSDVFLVNVNNDYLIELKRVFNYYHLPINLNERYSIYSSLSIQNFIKSLEETNNLNESLKLLENTEYYNKVIDIINKYNVDEIDKYYIDIIKNELKNTFKDKVEYDNSINVISFEDMILKDKYYYILNFNQGEVPKVFHDDDFIKDDIKKKIGLNTSLEKLINNKNKIINILNNFKNIKISYKEKDDYKEYIVSPLVNELNLNVIDNIKIKYLYSNGLNKLYLGMMLDNYLKFNIVNNDLNDLYTTYKDIKYLSYDNSFKNIDYELIKKQLKNKINLSYSSINNYFKCPFKFYINNILKLDPFEDTFMAFIGNLFHDCLSKMYEDNFDLKKTYYDYIKDKELSNKEQFFIDKLYSNLEDIIDVIKYQDRHSMFNDSLTEEEVKIDIDNDIETIFTGKIDKIKSLTKDGVTYISLIDYKTGSKESTLDNINYGLNLQLPIYVYLIKNRDKNVKIAGFYLQNILNSISIDSDDSKKEMQDNLKLKGYTIDKEDIIEMFDSTYQDSDVIKSMKKVGDKFYHYTKLVSEEDINNIISLVDKHIKEVLNNIKLGCFNIAPIRLDNDETIDGCSYCNYKDVCYRKEEDINNQKYIKTSNLFGGDK